MRSQGLNCALAGIAIVAVAACSKTTETRRRLPRAPITFNEIAPILFDNCASCHRPIDAQPGAACRRPRRRRRKPASPKPSAKAGSPDDPICVAGAPFSVLDYESVRRNARAIASAVQRRAMPPWLPEPGHGVFAGERRLSDDQIALIAKWVESGAPEGNPADVPKPPTFSGGWQLGTPDLVLTLPEPYVLQPGSRDVFRNFVIPVPIDRDALRARRRVPRRSPTGAAPRGSGDRSRTRVARARSCRTGSRFRDDGRRSGAERVRLVAGQGSGDGGRPTTRGRSIPAPTSSCCST